MAQQKLYTEEQVRKAYNEGCWNGFNEIKDKEDDIINSLTPIELPSDEEIKEASPIVNVNAHDYYFGHLDGFIDGAKWMRDKILTK